jgi:hypothetical protein
MKLIVASLILVLSQFSYAGDTRCDEYGNCETLSDVDQTAPPVSPSYSQQGSSEIHDRGFAQPIGGGDPTFEARVREALILQAAIRARRQVEIASGYQQPSRMPSSIEPARYQPENAEPAHEGALGTK